MGDTRWCGGCVAETAFERFDCAEHEGDCVELVCVRCGAGVELAPVQVMGKVAVRVSTAA
ncbi:MAG TPA: hypothetical protein VFQ85_18190 [Mycobacteriales bacterium]|jgi:hypothetical protein|nr:hypothetical protein [Mycobacteriales bacterium]